MHNARFPLLILAATATLFFTNAHAAEPIDVEQYREAAVKRWEKDIAELEARDGNEAHPDDSILFVGSSSIRRWDTIGEDLQPYHAIQRGYGGARWSDAAVFAERLITPHRFRAAVFFVGNDIAGKETDRNPAEVAGLFAHVLKTLRAHNPSAPVFYIAVTPTEKRWPAWPKIKAGNEAVRKFCEHTENVHFIGTESIFLDADGKPRPEFFADDQLHLNREGYLRWAAAVKSQLDSVLGGAD